MIDRFHGAIDEITLTLAEATGLDPAEFADRLTVNFDHDVAGHLFSVAAGLKSVVPGEFEVLGQLRRALELARRGADRGQRGRPSSSRARSPQADACAPTRPIARGTTSFAQAAAISRRSTSSATTLSRRAVSSCWARAQMAEWRRAQGPARRPAARGARDHRQPHAASGPTRSRTSCDDERVAVGALRRRHDDTWCVGAPAWSARSRSPRRSSRREHFAAVDDPMLVVDLGVPRAVAHDVDDGPSRPSHRPRRPPRAGGARAR